MSTSTENSQSASPPAVSVVVPAYRCARHIGQTLDSVFAQTFCGFEVIVVNDGCPDVEKLHQALNPFLNRLTYIEQANAGAAIARNRGVKESTGELIAFLDGDDVWKPEYLAEQVEFLRAGGFDMVYCDADLVSDEGQLGRTFMGEAPSVGEVSAESLLDLRSHVITSGTLITRAAFDAAGGFANERILAEDFHLWVRAARSGARIGWHQRVLLNYRVSDDGLSGDEVNRIERAIDVFERIDRELDLTKREREALRRHLRSFKTDLWIARAKSHLTGGENREAAIDFAKAVSRRPRPRIAAAAVLSVLAPALLRRKMKTNARPAHASTASDLQPKQ